MPVANASRWAAKFAANGRRDEEAKRKLEADGWRVEVVWECETRAPAVLAKRLEKAFKQALKRSFFRLDKAERLPDKTPRGGCGDRPTMVTFEHAPTGAD